ncbi:MAG TPA: hypothetical protein VIL20_07875 [Sandaracinaceae bacterium]
MLRAARPGLIRPHATYAICRRVNEHRFLLRPDPALNQLFTWVLAVTAASFDVEVLAATVMFHPTSTSS